MSADGTPSGTRPGAPSRERAPPLPGGADDLLRPRGLPDGAGLPGAGDGDRPLPGAGGARAGGATPGGGRAGGLRPVAQRPPGGGPPAALDPVHRGRVRPVPPGRAAPAGDPLEQRQGGQPQRRQRARPGPGAGPGPQAARGARQPAAPLLAGDDRGDRPPGGRADGEDAGDRGPGAHRLAHRGPGPGLRDAGGGDQAAPGGGGRGGGGGGDGVGDGRGRPSCCARATSWSCTAP